MLDAGTPLHRVIIKRQRLRLFIRPLAKVTRVESKVGGAEIRLSDRAKADIDEQRPKAHENLVWRKCPDCELKGFTGKHRLWSVS